MTLSFMIRKKYLEEKVLEQEQKGTFIERREYTKFWRVRIGSTHAWRFGGEAVFLCGRHAWCADVIDIKIEYTPDEIKDVIHSKICYEIKCRFGTDELERLQMKFPVKTITKV